MKAFFFAVLALSLSLPAHALFTRRNVGKNAEEVRFRFAGSMGSFSQKSQAAGSSTSTEAEGSIAGLSIDAEIWMDEFAFRIEGKHLPGPSPSASSSSVTLSGAPSRFDSGAAGLGYRAFGNGKTSSTEGALFAGVGIHSFSDVQTYPGATFYDRRQINWTSANLGVRFRLAVSKDTVLELAGNYMRPMTVVSPKGTTLNKNGSSGYGGTFAVEYKYFEGMAVGGGWSYESKQLSYRPAVGSASANGAANSSSYIYSAPFVYLKTWF